jgi:hypothetical protein
MGTDLRNRAGSAPRDWKLRKDENGSPAVFRLKLSIKSRIMEPSDKNLSKSKKTKEKIL